MHMCHGPIALIRTASVAAIQVSAPAAAASAPTTSDVAAKLDEALKMALAESLTKADKAEGKPAAAKAAAAEAKATATLERAELKEIKQDLKEFREVCVRRLHSGVSS